MRRVALWFAAACLGLANAFTRDGHQAMKDIYRTNTAGFAYVGCYRDDGASRDLPVFKQDSPTMTPHACNALCGEYDYFGVQMTQCYCGNSYGSVQAPSSGSGITNLEHGQAQVSYETSPATGQAAVHVQVHEVDSLGKFTAEGCYHDCGDGTLPCGGLNRNSVYRRPSSVAGGCTNGKSTMLSSRGICDPDPAALAPAAMPPCADSATSSCDVKILGQQSPGYANPWDTQLHKTFSGGHIRANPPARMKTHLEPEVPTDDTYNIHRL